MAFSSALLDSVRKCNAPEQTTAVFNRGNPNVFNMALQAGCDLEGEDCLSA